MGYKKGWKCPHCGAVETGEPCVILYYTAEERFGYKCESCGQTSDHKGWAEVRYEVDDDAERKS